MSGAYTFSDVSLSIGGVTFGVGTMCLPRLGDLEVERAPDPFRCETTFSLSPETTGAMPDCVRRTRRSRRRWRGKGSAWNGFFRAFGCA